VKKSIIFVGKYKSCASDFKKHRKMNIIKLFIFCVLSLLLISCNNKITVNNEHRNGKKDSFKYWTSYRTEGGKEYGIANNNLNGEFHIEDAAPYVVYKEEIPINRIVVKTQTNIGKINLGPFSGPSGIFADPFFGEQNKTTPVKWKVQYLKNNTWVDAISFNGSSIRSNGEPIFSSDGYVEIGYGLIIPEVYRSNFLNNGTVSSTNVLPLKNDNGQAYLVRPDENER
jgi:hypothetical protein